MKQILTASARYASARARLAMLETKLAAQDVKKATLLFIAAVFGALTGFALLSAGLVLGIAKLLLNGNTALAAALTGVVFLGVAFLLARTGSRSVRGKSFYPVTKAELHQDKQWLHKLP